MRVINICAAGVAVLVALWGGAAPVGNAAATLCAAQPSNFGPASRPFAPSQQLASLGQARSRIAFEPRLPAGRPFRMYVSREREAKHRRLGLAYRASKHRWFLVSEQRATSSRARFDEFIRELTARDECGDAVTLRLRDGNLALAIRSADRHVLRLRTHGIDILLFASPRSASPKRLAAIANQLAR